MNALQIPPDPKGSNGSDSDHVTEIPRSPIFFKEHVAYQVLARKWRPQSFDALVGQETVATGLLNTLKNDRVPHALLFTGVRGVGKTSAARILAKSLRCTNLKEFVPCGVCSDCVEIAEGRSIDVIEIDGASNNGVENVRELRESVGFMPSRGKYKIYIIDEVHMLTGNAFNALLKTLEEPPPHVMFIFATTEVQKIPVTILSRCQRYDFRRIAIKKVAEAIRRIAESEGVEAETSALWLVARESEGSMRDSLSLLDQVISFCGNKITLEKVVEILGLTDRTLLSQTLKALIDRNAEGSLDIVERVFKLGYDPKQFAQDLLEHIRNLMVVKLSGHGRTDFLDLPDQEVDELLKFSGELSNEDIHFLFDMTLKGVNDVMRAQDPRVVMEMLLLRMSQAPRLSSIENLLADMETGPVTTAASTATAPVISPSPATSAAPAAGYVRTIGQMAASRPAPQPSAAAVASTPTQDYNSIPEPLVHTAPIGEFSWAGFVERVKKEKPLLGAKLEYGSMESLDDKAMGIFFRKEQSFFYAQVSDKDVLLQLGEIVMKNWGKSLRVNVRIGVKPNEGTMSSQETTAAQEKTDHLNLMEKIDNHPVVQEAKSLLNAKVTGVSES